MANSRTALPRWDARLREILLEQHIGVNLGPITRSRRVAIQVSGADISGADRTRASAVRRVQKEIREPHHLLLFVAAISGNGAGVADRHRKDTPPIARSARQILSVSG